MRHDWLAILNEGAAPGREQRQEVGWQSSDIKPERIDIPQRRCGYPDGWRPEAGSPTQSAQRFCTACIEGMTAR